MEDEEWNSPTSSKRAKKDNCIIHCSDDNGKLVCLKSYDSWKTLLNAAYIRSHEPLLNIAKALHGEEIPKIQYHRKCRSLFTLKKNLDSITEKEKDDQVIIHFLFKIIFKY